MPTVVFLLVPGVHVLDLAGPAQVFSSAGEHGHEYRIRYVAESPFVLSAQGLRVAAEVTWPHLDQRDLVLVPGWSQSTRHAVLSEQALEWLRAHHRGGGTVASVCSGAEALGRAGLLDGRRCTTHHELTDRLAARYPRASVVRDVLFVADDRVVTSAGIASGIDLALHLVERAHGPSVAARVARSMVVYLRRNGNEPQAGTALRHRAHLSDTVHQVQDVIEARLAQQLPLAELASIAGCSERTLTRLFTSATGTTPLRYQQTLRLEHALRLTEQGSTLESAARAVGFRDARMLRRLRTRHHAASAR